MRLASTEGERYGYRITTESPPWRDKEKCLVDGKSGRRAGTYSILCTYGGAGLVVVAHVFSSPMIFMSVPPIPIISRPFHNVKFGEGMAR